RAGRGVPRNGRLADVVVARHDLLRPGGVVARDILRRDVALAGALTDLERRLARRTRPVLLHLDGAARADVDRRRQDQVLELSRAAVAGSARLGEHRAEGLARLVERELQSGREIDRGLAEVARGERAALDRVGDIPADVDGAVGLAHVAEALGIRPRATVP